MSGERCWSVDTPSGSVVVRAEHQPTPELVTALAAMAAAVQALPRDPAREDRAREAWARHHERLHRLGLDHDCPPEQG